MQKRRTISICFLFHRYVSDDTPKKYLCSFTIYKLFRCTPGTTNNGTLCSIIYWLMCRILYDLWIPMSARRTHEWNRNTSKMRNDTRIGALSETPTPKFKIKQRKSEREEDGGGNDGIHVGWKCPICFFTVCTYHEKKRIRFHTAIKKMLGNYTFFSYKSMVRIPNTLATGSLCLWFNAFLPRKFFVYIFYFLVFTIFCFLFLRCFSLSLHQRTHTHTLTCALCIFFALNL